MPKVKTIEDACVLGERNAGRCLSKEYKNNKTKLLWECIKGHRWESRYNDVDQGHWCPCCTRIK